MFGSSGTENCPTDRGLNLYLWLTEPAGKMIFRTDSPGAVLICDSKIEVTVRFRSSLITTEYHEIMKTLLSIICVAAIAATVTAQDSLPTEKARELARLLDSYRGDLANPNATSLVQEDQGS